MAESIFTAMEKIHTMYVNMSSIYDWL